MGAGGPTRSAWTSDASGKFHASGCLETGPKTVPALTCESAGVGWLNDDESQTEALLL
jgi:hypothetical protein